MPRQSRYLQATPRRCQTVSETVREPAGDSHTVGDDAKTVWSPAGYSQTVSQNSGTPAGTQIQSVSVP
ncbi:hypothetical protein DPMN_010570 [Dreissena polymorpha]|uniref:Uncharacterized protein n=1 Tax=Dreissena polymorpha TaxID=45954 RepID=A0A9D4RZ77_DREPO|nr:hypothetical protein DPMN_010570 [Dreissena polymorpha]